MSIYLSLSVLLAALLLWILRPRTPRRLSHPAGRLAPPPENFNAFLWMAALPPVRSVELPKSPSPQHAASDTSSTAFDSPEGVVAYWRAAGSSGWFGKQPAFDQAFRERYLALHEAAVRGDLVEWSRTPQGSLALLILLDQFPRNAFRGTPRMYASDALAREVAKQAIEREHDAAIDLELRLFMYLPFAHSELLADQERSLELNALLPEPSPRNAKRHHDIIERFGRFPHRNPILGRAMRPEEQAFLDEGGYAG